MLRFVAQQVLPLFLHGTSIKATVLRISTKNRKLAGGMLEVDSNWEIYLRLGQNELAEALRSELSRRDAIQRRSFAFLGTIAVVSAFGIGSLSLLRQPDHALSLLALALGPFCTLLFLAGSAWAALKISEPALLYDLFLQNRIGPTSGREHDLKVSTLHIIQLNQAQNLILSWYSERSFRCLRNGFVLIIFSIALFSLDSFLARRHPNTANPSTNRSPGHLQGIR